MCVRYPDAADMDTPGGTFRQKPTDDTEKSMEGEGNNTDRADIKYGYTLLLSRHGECRFQQGIRMERLPCYRHENKIK